MRTQTRLRADLLENPDAVVVITGVEDDHVNILNSHDGVRVYTKDHLDPRLLLGGGTPTFFASMIGAIRHYEDFKERGDKPPLAVQVGFRSALMYLESCVFADYTVREDACPMCGRM